jgi:hypothetical protein
VRGVVVVIVVVVVGRRVDVIVEIDVIETAHMPR